MRREAEQREHRRRHEAGDGDRLGGVGAADDSETKRNAEHRADHALARLHANEQPPERRVPSRNT